MPAIDKRYDTFAYECKLILHAYASRCADAYFYALQQALSSLALAGERCRESDEIILPGRYRPLSDPMQH
jgi:hypothetical protein